mmetsp:Transcript_12/g.8  ORF Transcript_12/g.8 Transcript_12/m.8 type:complete len:101 (-) Transcript_12:106-408(-)
MVQEDEIDFILHRCCEYIVRLFEHMMVNLEFSFDAFLVLEFKRRLKTELGGGELVAKTKWEDLVESNPGVEAQMESLRKQIEGLDEALRSVRSMTSGCKA